MSGSLFPLYITRPVTLRTRDERLAAIYSGHELPVRTLRTNERVELLDIFTEGFYCMTRHGKAVLPADALRPSKRRKRNAEAASPTTRAER